MVRLYRLFAVIVQIRGGTFLGWNGWSEGGCRYPYKVALPAVWRIIKSIPFILNPTSDGEGVSTISASHSLFACEYLENGLGFPFLIDTTFNTTIRTSFS